MSRTLAIADVHGEPTALLALINILAVEPNDQLVLLGDYVDRGPDVHNALRMVDFAMNLFPRTVALRGNHERMMIEGRRFPSAFNKWMRLGGDATLASFKLPPKFESMKRIPQWVWTLLELRLRDYFEDPLHLFVHAGAEPNVPLNLQPSDAVHWMLFGDVMPHQSGKPIVCGHTSHPTVRIYPHKICLDTGMGKSSEGRLTGADLTNGLLYQVDRQGNRIQDVPVQRAT